MTQAPPKREAAPGANQGRPETHDTGSHITPRPERKPTLSPGMFFALDGKGLSPAEIRQRIELKAAAVVTTKKGFAGFPPHIHELRNPKIQALVACGMRDVGWSIRDLIECTGLLGEVASSVLMETLDRPRWGPEDLLLLRHVAALENLSTRAWRGFPR